MNARLAVSTDLVVISVNFSSGALVSLPKKLHLLGTFAVITIRQQIYKTLNM